MKARLPRCLLVWCSATALLASAAHLVAEAALAHVTGGFETGLVRACGAAAVGCLAWAWLNVSAAVLEALRSRVPGRRRPAPRALRRLVLIACGVALTAPAPALADTPHDLPAEVLLAGLPYPERVADAAPAAAPRVVVVRPGDTLWSIAARHLPADAGAADVTRAWQRLHRHNRAVIGDDPDLIRPGQRLVLPD